MHTYQDLHETLDKMGNCPWKEWRCAKEIVTFCKAVLNEMEQALVVPPPKLLPFGEEEMTLVRELPDSKLYYMIEMDTLDIHEIFNKSNQSYGKARRDNRCFPHCCE